MSERSFLESRRRGRARVFALATLLPLFLVFARAFQLQVIEGPLLRQLSEENRMRPEIIPAPRGRILTRDGEVLADNAPAFAISLDPFETVYLRGDDRHAPGRRRRPTELAATVQRVAALTSSDALEMEKRIAYERTRSYRPIKLVRNADPITVARIEEGLAELPGVLVEVEPLRRYPHGTAAAHLLGYLGEITEAEREDLTARGYRLGDQVGRSGVERRYEDILHGRDGMHFVEVDALGRTTRLFPQRRPLPPEPGTEVELTILWRVQEAAERALDAAPSLMGEDGPPPVGALVALDPRDGSVLALASRPVFDPNEFNAGISHARWQAVHGAESPLLNRAIQSSYPPGSTFKMVTMLAGLESGLVDEHSRFSSCTGAYRFGSRAFRCWKPEGHGVLDLRAALVRSCDVFFYQAGLRLGMERLTAFAKSAGVDKPTGIDLPQERSGFIPSREWYDKNYGPRGWGEGVALNLAIGQGEILMTPIELAAFIGGVVTDGIVWQPRTLWRFGEGDDAVETAPRQARRLPVSAHSRALVKDAMEGVVMEAGGTGGRARVDDVRVGGKTGTAQNPHGEDHAVFVAFAPVESPEIVVACVLEERGHGGSMAAPVVGEVLRAYFAPDSTAAGAKVSLEARR